MASRRLTRELADLTNKGEPWFKINTSGDDLYKWKAVFEGPEDTPFSSGKFSLEFEIPHEYPFKAPKVKFLTKTYHPNIKSDGTICLDIIADKWTPQFKVLNVLSAIRELLAHPNIDHPLEADIAEVYKNDRNAYNKTAGEWTNKYAK